MTTLRLSRYAGLVLLLGFATEAGAQTRGDGTKPLSDRSGEDSALTFPTGRDLSRTIVRRNVGPSEVGFPNGAAETRRESDALRSLDETVLRIGPAPAAKPTPKATSADRRGGFAPPDLIPFAAVGGLGLLALAYRTMVGRRRRAELLHIS